jgi:predicted dehydrogenase
MAFRTLVRAFTDGIARRSSPHPNFDDGWRCQQVLDAARRSSDSGTVVQLG